MVFPELPLRVIEAFRLKIPGMPGTQVAEVDENVEPVAWEVESDAFTSVWESFRQRLMHFFGNEASEWLRGIKQE